MEENNPVTPKRFNWLVFGLLCLLGFVTSFLLIPFAVTLMPDAMPEGSPISTRQPISSARRFAAGY